MVIDDNNTDFDGNPPISVDQYDESIRLFCAAYDQIFVMAYSALRSMVHDDAHLLIVGAGTGMEICEFGRMVWELRYIMIGSNYNCARS